MFTHKLESARGL